MKPFACCALALMLAACYSDRTGYRGGDATNADTATVAVKTAGSAAARRSAAVEGPASVNELPDSAADAGGPLLVDSIGPLLVNERFFTVRFERVHYGGREHVRRLQIRDERGVAHYEETFEPPAEGGGPEWTMSVGAHALRGQRGQGLILFYQRMPSPPLAGWKLRIFGLRGSRLEPVAPHTSAHGVFSELPESREPNVLFLLPDERLDVEVWQGHFAMNIPLRVRLADCTPAVHPCIRPAIRRGDIVPGLSLLPVNVPDIDIRAAAILKLHDAPEGTFTVEVPVRLDSDVDVIEAAADIFNEVIDGTNYIRTRREWLHVRIDGRPGWVHGEQSFAAIGLAASR